MNVPAEARRHAAGRDLELTRRDGSRPSGSRTSPSCSVTSVTLTSTQAAFLDHDRRPRRATGRRSSASTVPVLWTLNIGVAVVVSKSTLKARREARRSDVDGELGVEGPITPPRCRSRPSRSAESPLAIDRDQARAAGAERDLAVLDAQARRAGVLGEREVAGDRGRPRARSSRRCCITANLRSAAISGACLEAVERERPRRPWRWSC